MNKTIYLRDEHLPVWERAKEITGGKLSDVIIELLRSWIDGRSSPEETIQRQERELSDLRARVERLEGK